MSSQPPSSSEQQRRRAARRLIRQLLDAHRVAASRSSARARWRSIAASSLPIATTQPSRLARAHRVGLVDRVVQTRHPVDRRRKATKPGDDRDQHGVLEHGRDERRPRELRPSADLERVGDRVGIGLQPEARAPRRARPRQEDDERNRRGGRLVLQRRRRVGLDRSDVLGARRRRSASRQAVLVARTWRRSCLPRSVSNSRISYIETIGTTRSASRKPVRNRPIVPAKIAQSQMRRRVAAPGGGQMRAHAGSSSTMLKRSSHMPTIEPTATTASMAWLAPHRAGNTAPAERRSCRRSCPSRPARSRRRCG